MPQDRDRAEPEVLPHRVRIGDVGFDADVFGPDALCGATASSLVVVDEAVGFGQTIELGEEIAVLEVGPAMEDEDWLPPSDLPVVETGGSDRDAALSCGRSALIGRRTGTGGLWSGAPSGKEDERQRGSHDPATLPESRGASRDLSPNALLTLGVVDHGVVVGLGGPRGARTRDLLIANQALSQLS